jgi:hypothetical protein
MRTDGQTDMTKLEVAFRNFAKAPKMPLIFLYVVLKFGESKQVFCSGCSVFALVTVKQHNYA